MSPVSIDNYSVIILILLSSLGIVCSIVTFYIVYAMRRFNGLLLLILSLSLSQLFYDLSIIMIAGDGFDYIVFYYALRTFSGLMTTFWTNVISLAVLYTVYFIRVPDVTKYYYHLLFAVGFPALVITLIDITGSVQAATNPENKLYRDITETYYWIRIVSILFNIITYTIMSIKLVRRTNISGTSTTADNDPIKALAYRMKYYPIVQILTRFGAAWYEFAFGYDVNYSANYSVLQQATLMIYSVTLPTAGIGFFIVFIFVTPGAQEEISKLLMKYIFCRPNNNDDDRIKVYNGERERGSQSQSMPGTINNPIGFGTDISSITDMTDFNSTSSGKSSISYNRYDEQTLTMVINHGSVTGKLPSYQMEIGSMTPSK